jgi:hypothetical protein
MRFSLVLAALAASASTGAAFAPGKPAGWSSRSSVFSTVEVDTETSVEFTPEHANGAVSHAATSSVVALTSAEINARLEKQLEKLEAKDIKSPLLSKEVSQ